MPSRDGGDEQYYCQQPRQLQPPPEQPFGSSFHGVNHEL